MTIPLPRPGAERLAGVLLFAEAALYVLATLIGETLAPGYHLGRDTISELGVVPATAALFNTAMIGVGVLTLGGGLALRPGDRWWTTAAYVLAGVGAIGVGLFPYRNAPVVHDIVAGIAFIGFNLLPLVTLGRAGSRAMQVIGVLCGLAGFVFLGLMIAGELGDGAFSAIGRGGTERMIVFPPVLWMLAFAGALLGRRA